MDKNLIDSFECILSDADEQGDSRDIFEDAVRDFIRILISEYFDNVTNTSAFNFYMVQQELTDRFLECLRESLNEVNV